VGIGEPRGHFAGGDSLLHGLGPGPGGLVSEERHGGGFSGTVAGLAVLLEEGGDVAVVGGGGGGGGGSEG
jgi:hypothetical protein